MPPLIAAAIGAVAIGLQFPGLTGLLLSITVFALGAASFFLAPNVGSFEQRLQGLLVSQRNAIAYGRRIFGLTRVGGSITYIDTTEDDEGRENGFLHLVVTLAYHRLDEILTVYFDDYPIHIRYLSSDGFVQIGTYGPDKPERFPILDPPEDEKDYRVRIQYELGVPPHTDGTLVSSDGLFGRASGNVNVEDYQPFPDLQAESPGWTVNHKQLKRAKLYIRMKADNNLFPGGIPNITAIVKGTSAMTDPRTDTTGWTPNPAICIRHLVVTNPAFACGLGAQSDEVDDDSFSAAANVCDERVLIDQSKSLLLRSFSCVTDADLVPADSDGKYRYFPIYFQTPDGTNSIKGADIQTGDGFVVTEGLTGSLPSGLTNGQTYYLIIKSFGQWVDFDLDQMKDLFTYDPGSGAPPGQEYRYGLVAVRQMMTVGFATTYQNAIDDIPIEHTYSENNVGAPDSTLIQFTGLKYDEARYQLNGVFEYDRTFAEVIEEMLSSMGARLVFAGGQYKLTSYSYVTPTYEFTQADLIAEPQVSPRLSRRDRFNVVNGVYSSPVNAFQPSSYPRVMRQTYIDNDRFDGTVTTSLHQYHRTMDLPFTTSPSAAQRLARIALERARQEITGIYPVGISGLLVTVGDTITISDDVFGWDSKIFEITTWKIAVREDPEGNPVFGVDLGIKEHASAIFDWTPSTDEAELPDDLATNTNLPPAAITPVINFQVSEELYQINSGIGVAARAIMTWNASGHPFIAFYELQYRNEDSTEYIGITNTTTTRAEQNGIEPGFYYFRIRAVNTIGYRSPWVEIGKEIFGLSAPPSAPTNLGVAQLSDALVMLTWDQSVDLDVLFGGVCLIRHDEDEFSGDVVNSVSIGSGSVPGNATSALVPNKTGTYIVLFRDSTGNYSPATEVRHVRSDSLTYSTLTTLTESPTFAGTKTNVQVISGELLLAYDTSTSPLFDVVSNGTYSFANNWSSGTSRDVRITTFIRVIIEDALSTIDERTEPIDTWPTFDGVLGIEADARVQVRLTQGDPAISPTPVQGDWQNVDCLFANVHNAEFRLVVTSDFGYASIRILELYVVIEEIV